MSPISTFQIFIGFEEREREAYDVCEYSIKKNSFWNKTRPNIIKLRSQNIAEYDRNHGEPQSTDFTFTRFWVPYLSGFRGYSVFVDCDFLFLQDIQALLDYADPDIAVHVVKHPPYIPIGQTKMDGISQHRSYRKNWASLMLFNNEHESNKILTPKYLNEHLPGLDFHHLKWLKDEEIGSLPLEWNCLDQYYYLEDPYAIHYTEGGPWFGKEFLKTRYGALWSKYNDERVAIINQRT